MNKRHETLAAPVRKLSGIETRMAIFHNNLQGSTQGTQIIGIECALSAHLLGVALRHLYDKYVPLQCSIQQIGGELQFCHGVPFEAVPIRVIDAQPGIDLEAIAGDEVDQPLDAASVLWKVAAVLDSRGTAHKIVMTAHHAIIDASGMSALARSLFEIIDSLIVRGAWVTDAVSPFPLPVDDLLREPKGASVAALPAAPRRHDQVCRLAGRRTGWKALVLDRQQLAVLVARADAERVKIHSVFSAAMCLAIEDIALLEAPIDFHTAVSLSFLRANHPGYANELGCFMAIASGAIDAREQTVSALAKKYGSELLRNIMTTCVQKSPVDTVQLEAATRKLAGLDLFAQGVGITNLGVIDIPGSYEALAVTEYMMLANRVAGNFAVVAHCYEFAGRQYINFVYPKPILADAAVTALSAAFARRLEEYCGMPVAAETGLGWPPAG